METEVEELPTGPPVVLDYGPAGSAVGEVIERAGRLTQADVHALTGAVAWQWQPIALPIRGSFVAACTEALAAARLAGRAGAAAASTRQAGVAALDSPGGRSIIGRRSRAEGGLAAILIGVIGAFVCLQAGLPLLATVFAVLAVLGAGAVLRFESARVAQRRLVTCVEAATLAALIGDLVPPETLHTLRGPWSSVMHD